MFQVCVLGFLPKYDLAAKERVDVTKKIVPSVDDSVGFCFVYDQPSRKPKALAVG